MQISALISSILLLSLAMVLGISFLREKSRRAALVSALVTCSPVPLLLWMGSHWSGSLWPVAAFWSLCLFLGLLLFIPLGRRRSDVPAPAERVDERTIHFARSRYQPGDGRYERFYEEYPQWKNIDDHIRSLPNLGEEGGKYFHPLNCQIPTALFEFIENIRESAEGPVASTRIPLSAPEASRHLIGLARHLGALSAGTTAVHPSHVYSRIGRGSGEWGEDLDPEDHPWAVVFTVEMDESMMRSTPAAPVIVDSARQYLTAATIACGLASYIRQLGYQARAHIDGNYRLVLPPLAADAGLGEVGRHSLLITPEAGSRVRIAAVSCDLPLSPGHPVDLGVEDFCKICLKCAHNCPSAAIPAGERQEVRGTKYWKIDPDACYRTWRALGTDCGLCISVCPYSRPSGWIHDFVRLACRRSALSRRIFARLDDVFYGKKPRCEEQPDWMRVAPGQQAGEPPSAEEPQR